MRSTREAWNDLSKLFQRYSGITDIRGDVVFAQGADISVATVAYLRMPGIGDMPLKEEVLKAISHLESLSKEVTPGIKFHMLDRVDEAYMPARREIRGLGMSDSMYYRSRK